jgi:hypothetical protein
MKIILPTYLKVEFEGESFYDEKLYVALENAIKYAGKNGRVLSFPELIRWRMASEFDSEAWEWGTANSEENTGKTSQGNSVVFAIHGGGILKPKRIENAIKDGLIDGVAQYTQKEFLDALEGKMSDNSEIPIYSFEEFKKINSLNLPIRYGVVMDLKKANSLKSGIYPIDTLRNSDLVILRCGGEETTNNYLDKLSSKGYKKIGNWHRFENVNNEKPSGLLLFLGNSSGDSIIGNYNLNDCIARFVGVKENSPEATQKISELQKPKIKVYTKEDITKALKDLQLLGLEKQVFEELNRKE